MTILLPTEPVVDEARIKRIYAELHALQEILDPDPLALGPKRINNKIARVRNMLKRCVEIELQLAEDLHYFKRYLTREKGMFDLEFQSLIANDPHVRAGRSQTDREASAKVKLAGRVQKIYKLEESVQDLEQLLSVVKTKGKDVRDIQSRLKDQIKICEHEIGLGARWGNSASPTYPEQGRDRGRENATSADLDHMDALVAGVDLNVPESPQKPKKTVSTPSPVEPEESEESAESPHLEIDDFLGALGDSDILAPAQEDPANVEIDVDSILEGLGDSL